MRQTERGTCAQHRIICPNCDEVEHNAWEIAFDDRNECVLQCESCHDDMVVEAFAEDWYGAEPIDFYGAD